MCTAQLIEIITYYFAFLKFGQILSRRETDIVPFGTPGICGVQRWNEKAGLLKRVLI